MDLAQVIENALAPLFGQSWPIFVLLVIVALLKLLLPTKNGRRKKRGSSARKAKSARQLKTEEELDYDRRLAGVAGELKIRTFVERRYGNSLHDIYLPSKSGVTQIDHIILAGGAFVVIETKNYGGLILGDEKGHKWTQVMAGGNSRNAFMNPIHQNGGHVLAVRMAIGDEASVPVRNLVVFVGDAKFGRLLPENVIVLSDLASMLERVTRENPASEAAMEAWSRLCSKCLAKPRSILEAEHKETLARRASRLQRKAG